MEPRHDTVLLEEAVAALDVQAGDTVVDATLGGAGHFSALLAKLGPEGALMGIDADEEAIARAEAAVAEVPERERPRVELVLGNFRDLGTHLDAAGMTPDKLLFDLGWSGFQLSRGRGFSFRANEPLQMTYGDPAAQTTAGDLVNHLSEESLAELLWSLGEERFGRSIARSIAARREQAPIATTLELAEAVEAGVPAWYRHRKTHAATKTFQALRIAANDELGALREGLATALERLPAGGRIAVITFHSIEDRIVKTLFRDWAADGRGSLATRKPVAPSAAELARNPRARSAKLRTFVAGAPARSITTHSFLAYA